MGAVLAGGASRRMGRDKALVTVGGIPMARLVADAMSGAGVERVVLVGGSTAAGDALGLGVVADLWPGQGPLAGAASAATWAEGEGARHVCVAACDQPNLTADVFSRLLDALDDARRHDPPPVGAVALTPDGRRHPFPAAWCASAAPRLRALVEDGSRRADAALALGVLAVPVPVEAVLDVDRPEDLPS